MKLAVSIDGSAWNWLFDNALDLSVALPSDEFSLFITRHVELELSAIPDEKGGEDKRPLKQYIQESISRNQVVTTATFGFAEANPPGGPAIYAGFGHGTFQSDGERAWYARADIQNQTVGKRPRKPGMLPKNAADASLGGASMSAVVLTADENKGPIKTALKIGGKVVFVSKLAGTKSLNGSLRDAVKQSAGGNVSAESAANHPE